MPVSAGFPSERRAALERAGIIGDVIPSSFPMNLEYALEIKLGGGQVVEDGEEVPKSAATEMPHIKWTYQGDSESPPGKLALAMVDPDAPKHNPHPPHRPVPQWCHLVLSHLTTHAPSTHQKALIEWAPPTPPKGSGPHRYVFLLFRGKDQIEIAGGRGGFEVAKWAEERGMDMVGAGWFIVVG